MSADAHTPPPATTLSPSERPTWRSLLAGSLVWFIHLNASYELASVACKWGQLSSTVAGVPALSVVEAGLTAAAALLLLAFIYLPWRDWRQYQSAPPKRNPHLLRETEQDRRPLAAFVTMLLNSTYLLFAIGVFVLIAALRPCAQA
jgi:hypothetical protein